MESFLAAPEDGLEEGEIVSDDLESISDDSMSFSTPVGKSLKPSDNLPALSLSSVSDLEESPLRRRAKRLRSQKRSGRHKKSRQRYSFEAGSSDSDSSLNHALKLQLKAAVHVESEDAHRNSLRTRLRAMVKDTSATESDSAEKVVCIQETTPVAVITITDDTPSSSIEAALDSKSVTPIVEESSTIDVNQSALNSPKDSPVDDLKEDEEIDNELIQLRIEALKTAINNKFGNNARKRKKSCQSLDETNKENSNSSKNVSEETKTEIGGTNQITTEISPVYECSVPVSPEEDEDVLRALLLASMSEKITKSNNNSKKPVYNDMLQQQTSKNLLTKINVFKLNNNLPPQNKFKKIVNQGKAAAKPSVVTSSVIVPKVKPLIIKVSSDSESDMDFLSSPEKPVIKKHIAPQSLHLEKEIEINVDKFLKEQRKEVESKIKTNKVSNIATSMLVKNDTECNVRTYKFHQPKNNQVQEGNKKEAVSSPFTNLRLPHETPKKTKNAPKMELEKSALKFLPASKREEYKKLQHLLKIKKAQMKRPKVRWNSQKINDISVNTLLNSDFKARAVTVNPNINRNSSVNKTNKNSLASVTPSLDRVKSTVHKGINVSISTSTQATQTDEPSSTCNMEEKQKQSLMLRNTLKQIRCIKDERLQIQERYKSLRPLLKNLNEVSKDQKKCDQKVELLTSQLAKLRECQKQLHKKMLSSVKKLQEEKGRIDLSINTHIPKPKPTQTLIAKPPTTSPSDPHNSANGNISLKTSLTLPTLLSNEAVKDPDRNRSPMAKTGRDSGNEAELNITDPNDIDTVIKYTEEQVAKLGRASELTNRKHDKVKYVSPLDLNPRKQEFDPFGIMCPFEVAGTCRDPDCTYNHLNKDNC